MIKPVVRATTLLTVLGVVIAAGVARADCVCPHYPMYEVSGGWFHYATVHEADCGNSYPTGYVAASPQSNMLCSGACMGCIPLGDQVTVPDFSFDKDLLTYAQISPAGKFRQYLEQIFGSPINTYGLFTFTAMGTVELKRNIGGSEQTFHAAIFKMAKNGTADVPGYLGIEISNPTGGTALAFVSQCNTVFTHKDLTTGKIVQEPVIAGMLTVALKLPSGQQVDAFVRLNTTTNMGAGQSLCNQGRSLLTSGAGGQPCTVTSAPVCCKQRKARCRKKCR